MRESAGALSVDKEVVKPVKPPDVVSAVVS
ncbi:hypothetical protein ESCNG_690002 [Neisseria gonorrhoeae]|nr:hypothetical protein ESCNG_690002 [Neisseria gonorrhoeae]